MGNKFSSGKWAISICDRCGFRYPLKSLKCLTIKLNKTNIKVCPECFEQDHPQLMVGMYPVDDPQALRDPRPDTTYVTSGVNTDGYPQDGSRYIQWGWAPVGGSRSDDASLTPNNLVSTTSVGSVTVTIS